MISRVTGMSPTPIQFSGILKRNQSAKPDKATPANTFKSAPAKAAAAGKSLSGDVVTVVKDNKKSLAIASGLGAVAGIPLPVIGPIAGAAIGAGAVGGWKMAEHLLLKAVGKSLGNM